jgi:hypothetical protein
VGSGFRAVACGYTHTLVHKIDDSLWKLAQPLSPIATGVESMAAGLNYSMYVTREGQLYGMGNNENGQLGDGTLTLRSTPVLLGMAQAAACGDYHSAVLDGRPVIVSQPVAATVEWGQVVELSVNAIGSAPLTYQWYRGEAGDESQPLEGAVTATYGTGPLAESSTYWVRVGNRYGQESSLAATLTVATAPAAASRSAGAPDPAIGAVGSDADPLIRYALAADSLAPGEALYTAGIKSTGTGSALVLTHRRTIGAAITITYEWSDDLVEWHAFTPQLDVQSLDERVEKVTASRPIHPGERTGYLRVNITEKK